MPDSERGARTLKQELAFLQQQIEQAETELIEREAELVDLRVEISAFRLEYDTRIGRKIAELEEVEAELERCREQVRLYRQWGPDGPPLTRGGMPYTPVEEQYRRTWRQPVDPSAESAPGPGQDAWWAGQGRPAVTEAQVKKLYRQLCHRFHPDLTQDPAERERRTQIMAAINVAYGERTKDMQRCLAELQALAEKADLAPEDEPDTDERRLVAWREKLSQIRRRLEEAGSEIHELTNSPAMQMSLDVKLARRSGRDLLAEMAADVEKELVRKRVELDFLKAQLRQLGLVS